MRKSSTAVFALVAAAALAAALPAVGSPRAQSSATKTVKVADFAFRPSSIRIRRNTKVVWRWTGATKHNVKVTKGPVKFKSRTQVSGTYSKKLTKKGTYRYICSVHPFMHGKIVVR